MLREFDQDTIAAIVTPSGEGGVGVIRISGPEAIRIADKIFESTSKRSVQDQKSFTARHGFIFARDGSGQKRKIDEVILLLMRSPKSYTREDVVEISAHAGPVVLKTILELVIQKGARLAARGEFTKRAFLNGRMDLLQAEAVLDLVKSRTEMGQRWATAQLTGLLSEKMKAMKDKLLNILSHCEASIDFPEDALEPQSSADAAGQLKQLEEELSSLLSKAAFGFIVKNGLKVVIAGRPNVGKSSLMNCLVKANRVIVTPFAGTTRDTVEEEIQIHGFPVRMVDTAGLRESDHPIEKEGIERSKAAVAGSDLVLFVVDGSQEWNGEDEALLKELGDRRKILVVNKSDLPQKFTLEILKTRVDGMSAIRTSCVQEKGTDLLEKEIFCLITHGQIQASDESVVSSVRQKSLLEKTLQCIQDAKLACISGLSPELVAADVRQALDHLGTLVGEVVTDDILDQLFNQFCIGK